MFFYLDKQKQGNRILVGINYLMFVYYFKEIENFYENYKERIRKNFREIKNIVKIIKKMNQKNIQVRNIFKNNFEIFNNFIDYDLLSYCNFSDNCEFLGTLDLNYLVDLIKKNKIEKYFKDCENEILTVSNLVNLLKIHYNNLKKIFEELDEIDFSIITINLDNIKIIFRKNMNSITMVFRYKNNDYIINSKRVFVDFKEIFNNEGLEKIKELLDITERKDFKDKLKKKILNKKIKLI